MTLSIPADAALLSLQMADDDLPVSLVQGVLDIKC